MAQIYYLANIPTYIYTNIVDIFANIDFKNVSEEEINVYEESLKNDDRYMLYLFIYIRIKNGYKLDENRYENLKWYEEFISYCKSKQSNNTTSLLSIGNEYKNNNNQMEYEYGNNNNNQEVNI
jgi:hypothetical protein